MEMEPTGTQLMLFKKKKKNARHGTQMCDSNGYLVNSIKTRFVQVFFFFFLILENRAMVPKRRNRKTS